MDFYLGYLVVLRSRWNLRSNRLGVVVGEKESTNDVVLVMWTDEDGVRMRYHLKDALVPVTEATIDKIGERICDIKSAT